MKPFEVGNILRNKAVPDQSSFTTFFSDTGLILLLNSHCLVNFVETFSYAKLVESNTDLINFEYWDSLVGKFDYYDCALIYASTGGRDLSNKISIARRTLGCFVILRGNQFLNPGEAVDAIRASCDGKSMDAE